MNRIQTSIRYHRQLFIACVIMIVCFLPFSASALYPASDSEIEAAPQDMTVGTRILRSVSLPPGFTLDMLTTHTANMTKEDLYQLIIKGLEREIQNKEKEIDRLKAGNRYLHVDVNTATIEEMTSALDIDYEHARRIVRDRAQNGRFKTIDEVGNVFGISDSLLLQLSGKITAGSPEEPDIPATTASARTLPIMLTPPSGR